MSESDLQLMREIDKLHLDHPYAEARMLRGMFRLIAKAEEKLKQLKAEQQKVEARKKAAETKRSRQDDTRRKVLVGAVVLAKLEDGSYPEAEFTARMDAALSRAEDRKLFGLAVTEPQM